MIEVHELTKKFGDFLALNNVSFSVPSGEVIGLLGPNGAGKTTTMRVITGFFPATSGSVTLDDIDVKDNPLAAKAKIGYMSESAPLYVDMIVFDYLAYIADIYGVNKDEKIPLLVKECGLKAVMHKTIASLSRGNKQRVALAAALMNDPQILILDEPTSGLDPNQVEDVRALIREIGKTRTVILSTHILSEVEAICSRVIIISGGRVVADSPVDQLRARYRSGATVRLRTKASEVELSSALSKVSGVANISSVKGSDEDDIKSFVISLNSAGQEGLSSQTLPLIAKAIVTAELPLYELVSEQNSLEDVFHLLTEPGKA